MTTNGGHTHAFLTPFTITPRHPTSFSSIFRGLSTAYPPTRLQKSLANPVFFNGGAILTPTNEAVVRTNDVLLKRLLGEVVLTFHADDTGDIKDGSHEDFTSFCSPTHAPVMLLRNLDPIHGHCNRTQMMRLRASAQCLDSRGAAEWWGL